MARAVKQCVPCIGSIIKQSIVERNKELRPVLEVVEDCEDDWDLDLCAREEAPARTAKGEKAKRAPSAYNQFIGQCMRTKNIKGTGNAPAAMKECAAEWRQAKATA